MNSSRQKIASACAGLLSFLGNIYCRLIFLCKGEALPLIGRAVILDMNQLFFVKNFSFNNVNT